MIHNKILPTAIRMFARLLSYHIMCLVVSVTILIFLPNKFGNLIAQIFDLCIILILPYLTIWKMGDTDRNQFNFDHIQRDNLKGLKIGLIAYAPIILAGLLMIFAKLGVISPDYIKWYRIINSPFLPFNQMLMPTTLTLAEQSIYSVLISSVTTLIMPFLLFWGYRLGFERISFFETYLSKKFKTKKG